MGAESNAMHIQELWLDTRHLAPQRAFYSATLGLPPVAEAPDSFTVQAGTTLLRFQQTEQDVLYHIAFTIPQQRFYEAKRWVQNRVPLLRKNGKDELFFAGLNARSFYFCDPAGNILEYIVHHGLAHEAEGAAFVLHVSEIGLPVEDVPAFADLLQQQFAIKPYGGGISEYFAFLGDIFGQLVVVKVGRPWLPTDTIPAAIAPVRLTIRGQRERQIQLLPYPYIINETTAFR